VKKSIHADIPVILVYLFWEPSDRVEYPVFAHHRDQIEKVSDLLRGSSVKFLPLSYPELWQEMVARAPTSGLRIMCLSCGAAMTSHSNQRAEIMRLKVRSNEALRAPNRPIPEGYDIARAGCKFTARFLHWPGSIPENPPRRPVKSSPHHRKPAAKRLQRLARKA
jgi:hypothetical protein